MILFIVFLGSILAFEIRACKTNDICPVTTVLSEKQHKQLQLELLTMLGLPSRPEKVSSKQMKYSSKYLLEIYQVLNDERRENNRIKRDANIQLEIREDEVNKADRSDVIVSLNSVNKKSDGVGKRQKLSFFTKSVPKSTGLFGAELKVYQNKKLVQNLPYTMYTISVYKQSIYDSNKMKKVAEKITSTDFTGWLSIDISFTFNNWLENITLVKDLFISVKPYGIIHEKEIHPASIGIIFQHKQNENEPFIVAFLKAENKVKPRVPRDIMLQPKKVEFLNSLEKDAPPCGIHSLRVSFKDLGWNDWVIAPEGYTTAYCQGSCIFPIKFPQEVTNHALVQSLVQLKHPDQFPMPSCAPTQLNSLSVLYRERENTILKKYKNMIASSCGCH